MAVCCSPALTLIYSAPDLDRSVSIIWPCLFCCCCCSDTSLFNGFLIVFSHFLFTRYLSSLTESGTE